MYVCMCGCFGNMCTSIYCVLYCFVYVYLFLFVLSVLVWGLLPPSDNSIAVNNNNNNNNKRVPLIIYMVPPYCLHGPPLIIYMVPLISLQFGTGDAHNLLNNFGFMKNRCVESTGSWMHVCPLLPHLLTDFVEIRRNRSARNAVEHLWVLCTFGMGTRQYCCCGLKWSYVHAWIVELFDSFKVKNALMTPLWYVADCCS